jgi:hypothetical protein
MRIEYSRSGGFANIELASHLNTDDLPQEEAAELRKLVDNSGVFELEQKDFPPAKRGAADVFSYRLTVAEGNKQKTLSFNDMTAPASLRPLLTRLEKFAMDEKRKGKL